MGRLIMFNMVTMDGYFDGPKKWDLDWHQVDNEFNGFSIEQLNESDGIVFGRITYEGMASYWPTPEAMHNDPEIAKLMNAKPKFVFSTTLDSVSWNNSRLVNSDAGDELKLLKQQAGKDLLLFGSADLAATFMRNNQIDEFRLMVNPIVLGRGVPLFKENGTPRKLNLTKTRTFHNGNVLLYYSTDH
jgi:dihydrofolate reductase